jgi:putative acetyltransferase
MHVTIRTERPDDVAQIRAVNLAAFDTHTEATLVDLLRAAAHPIISLVAERDDEIVGHILFSPVTLSCHPDLPAMGLAPMAVTPSRQRQGLGSLLVARGLEECRHLGTAAVFVLGHPEFYPRFEFIPASTFGLRCEYEATVEAFMALELVRGALAGADGVVTYHPAFASI